VYPTRATGRPVSRMHLPLRRPRIRVVQHLRALSRRRRGSVSWTTVRGPGPLAVDQRGPLDCQATGGGGGEGTCRSCPVDPATRRRSRLARPPEAVLDAPPVPDWAATQLAFGCARAGAAGPCWGSTTRAPGGANRSRTAPGCGSCPASDYSARPVSSRALRVAVVPGDEEPPDQGDRPARRGRQHGDERQPPGQHDPTEPPRHALTATGRPHDVTA